MVTRGWLPAVALLAAGRTGAQHSPANWVHVSPGCIQGSNIGEGHSDSVEECLQLCLEEPQCVAVEYSTGWAP